MIITTHKRGFALVVTLTLMVLLSIIALGLLSLSTIEIRKQTKGNDLLVARANARLAAMLAISELQQLAGIDTRITAPAALANSNEAPYPATGVWRSWEGTDRQADGLPLPPQYSTKFQKGDPTTLPEDAAASDGRFLGWLVSGLTDTEKTDPNEAPDLSKGSSDKIMLVGPGSTANDVSPDSLPQTVPAGKIPTLKSQHVYVNPTLTTDADDETTGAFGWWVSGENQKVRVQSREATNNDVIAAVERSKSDGFPDLEYLDFPDDQSGKINISVTNKTLDLVSANTNQSDRPSYKNFHNISAYSKGLLTNSATGGWRKDLSLFTENWNSLPSSNLPLLHIKPGQYSSVKKATSSDTLGNDSLLFPWAETLVSSDGGLSNPVTSWNSLVDFATHYKYISSSTGSGNVSMPAYHEDFHQAPYSSVERDRVTRMPLAARIYWILSYSAEQITDPADPAIGKYHPYILATPVVTLWNPYNVTLERSKMGIRLTNFTNYKFKFQVGTNILPEMTLEELLTLDPEYPATNGKDSVESTSIEIDIGGSMAAGESRIFSPVLNDPIKPSRWNKVQTITLARGVRTDGGIKIPVFKDNGTTVEKVTGEASDTFSATATLSNGTSKFNNLFYILAQTENSSDNEDGQNKTAWIGSQRFQFSTNDVEDTDVYKSFEAGELTATTLGAAESIPNAFMASEISLRTSERYIGNTKGGYLTRGLIMNNPLALQSSIGTFFENKYGGTYKGMKNPVNAPYNISITPLTPIDSYFPSETASNNSFIVTGSTPQTGLTHAVIAELPLQPLQSLGELRHLHIHYNNFQAPFVSNPIANSSAQPLIPADQAVLFPSPKATQYDESYVMNNILFDDWFVSSITPKLGNWSSSSSSSPSAVYERFVNGTDPLPNAQYKPSSLVDLENTSDDVTSDQSYLTIASRLSVDGMFNVNSTSLTAWKAFLRHRRGAEVPFIDGSGSNWSVSLDSNNDQFPFTRTSVAGDRESRQGGHSGFTGSNEFSGYRSFTDDQIDALAEYIVAQVKERGPFLSLSEFVNRKLTSSSAEKKLALGGTIQAALNELANESGSLNPFRNLQTGREITTFPGSSADYAFQEAAQGWTTEGLPGWTRQADVLTPIAPLLTVRDDTFVIRAYGDARDQNNKISATAWCEIVVTRSPNFVDETDPAASADDTNSFNPSQSLNAVNERFGRKFEIVSFRWLSAKEI